jgi:hypothetical protein
VSYTASTRITSVLDPEKKIHRQIEEATAGLARSWTKSHFSVPENIAAIIADYIKAMKLKSTYQTHIEDT